MNVNGRCHCGRVQFEADVDPDDVAICHCADCQSLSGSPYRAMVRAASGSFVITGELKIYIKTAESGTRRAQAFCPNCGSAIYAAAPENPEVYSIRIGSITQRHDLGLPRRQIWCDSAFPWAMDLRDVRQIARQP